MRKHLSMAVALFLVAALSLGIAACGGSGSGTAATTTAAAAETTAAATTAAAAAETTAAAAASSADAVELIWLMGDPGKIPPAEEEVEAYLNELSVPAVGAKMKTLFMNDENIRLYLNSGDAWDIAFTCEWFNNYATQAAAGYFADLTEKLPSETPELYATMPEVVWQGAKVNGKIYAVPVKKDYAAEIFYRFDKALFVDELGMEIPESMEFADIEAYMKAAKDAWAAGLEAAKQAEYPLILAKGMSGLDTSYDMLNRDVYIGIPYSAVGTADETKVVLVYEDSLYQERVKLLRKWFEAGYVNKDAATLETAPTYIPIKVGQGFYGADAIWSGSSGYTELISKFSGPYLSSASIRGAMNAINKNSKNIDLALKYTEYLNTNKEYRDALRYGIPGKHWNMTEDGLAKRTEGASEQYGIWQFAQGSYSLSAVEAAEGIDVDPNMWQVIFDSYKDAIATKDIGFSYDPANVEPQIAALRAVREKYNVGLSTGTIDPDAALASVISEMEAAGIRDVIADCQKQLDEWLAANPQ